MEFDWAEHWWIALIIGALLFGLFLHITIELVYFIRMFLYFFFARFVKKKIHVLEKCSIKGICTTRDVDMILTHMNNARYLREVDFARIDFYVRTRLYDVVRSQRGQILLGATNVRFRKFIGLFQRYKLTTKIVYWNEDSIFIKHKFVGRDGFVHATLLCQQRVTNCSAEAVMDILFKHGTNIPAKPDIPLEVAKFLELQDISKKSLNNNNIV